MYIYSYMYLYIFVYSYLCTVLFSISMVLKPTKYSYVMGFRHVLWNTGILRLFNPKTHCGIATFSPGVDRAPFQSVMVGRVLQADSGNTIILIVFTLKTRIRWCPFRFWRLTARARARAWRRQMDAGRRDAATRSKVETIDFFFSFVGKNLGRIFLIKNNFLTIDWQSVRKG